MLKIFRVIGDSQGIPSLANLSAILFWVDWWAVVLVILICREFALRIWKNVIRKPRFEMCFVIDNGNFDKNLNCKNFLICLIVCSESRKISVLEDLGRIKIVYVAATSSAAWIEEMSWYCYRISMATDEGVSSIRIPIPIL